MLDEEEFAGIARLHKESSLVVKDFRRTFGTLLVNVPLHEIYEPVRTHYERITGIKESNHDEILMHRVSLYGPLCKRCQKPLRTPRAKVCGACMLPVQE